MPTSSEIEGLLSRAADEMRAEGQNGWPIICDDAAAELRRLSTELQELRAALRPFVIGDEATEQILWGHLPDDATGTVTVKLADFRRARAALTPSPGAEARQP